jgi:serine/threonine protein kinase
VQDAQIRKQIISELKVLHKTHSEYVISFFDAFYAEGNIFIALEYMDGGSLAHLLNRVGKIPEIHLGFIAIQVRIHFS